MIMDDFQSLFPRWLRREMNRKGWSESEVARRTGYPRQTVNYHTSGKLKKPDLVVLKTYCAAFETSLRIALAATGLAEQMTTPERRLEEVGLWMSQMSDEEQVKAVEVLKAMAGGDANARKNKKGTRRSP